MVSEINQLGWDYEIYNMHHYKYENHEYEHSCCHAMNYQHD